MAVTKFLGDWNNVKPRSPRPHKVEEVSSHFARASIRYYDYPVVKHNS